MTEPPQPPDPPSGGPPEPPPYQSPPAYQSPPPYQSPGPWGSPGAPTAGGDGVPPPFPGGNPQQPYQAGGPRPDAGGPAGYGAPAGGQRADRPGLGARLGIRTVRRPEPRLCISLAGAGMALVLIGVLIWAGGYFADGLQRGFDSDGGSDRYSESRRFLGAGLSFVVVVVGYALMIRFRRGPAATAGALAGAIGVPLALGFLTLNVRNVLVSGDFLFDVDVVFLLSIAVWLISYLFVPGAQGRAFYLGLAAVGLASYLSYKAAGNSGIASAASSLGVSTGGGGSLGGVAAVGLICGLAYYGIAALLDRVGRSGVAVALAFAGFVATIGGISSGIPTFHQVGTGVVLIVVGALLAWYGGRFGRRFTTWVWTVAVVVGIVVLVADAISDNATAAGIVLIVIGAGVAVAAQFLVGVLREAPEFGAQTQPGSQVRGRLTGPER